MNQTQLGDRTPPAIQVSKQTPSANARHAPHNFQPQASGLLRDGGTLLSIENAVGEDKPASGCVAGGAASVPGARAVSTRLDVSCPSNRMMPKYYASDMIVKEDLLAEKADYIPKAPQGRAYRRSLWIAPRRMCGYKPTY